MSWIWKKNEDINSDADTNKGNVEVFWGQKGSFLGDEDDEDTPPPSSTEDITVENSADNPEESELWKSFMAVSVRNGYDDISSEESGDDGLDDSVSLQGSGTSVGVNDRDGSVSIGADEEYVKKNLRAWVARCRREEVFQPGYEPTQEEALEVENIVKELRIGAKINHRGSGTIMKRHSDSVKSKAHDLLFADSNMMKNNEATPISNKGNAVLLLKGPLNIPHGSLFAPMTSANKKQKELIVFNNSFIIANITSPSSNRRSVFGRTKGGKFAIQKNIEICEKLSSVVAVVDLDISLYSHKDYKSSQVSADKMIYDDTEETENRPVSGNKYNRNGFRIVLPSKSYSFDCLVEEMKQMWIDGLSIVVMNAKKRGVPTRRKPDNADESVYVGDEKNHSVLMTTIFSAVVCGDHDMLQRVIESDKLPVDTPDSMGLTALHYAVIKNRTACVRTLLDAGADVNRQDLTGKTPGFYGKSKRVLDLLAASGANFDDFPELTELTDEENSDDQKARVMNVPEPSTSPKSIKPAKKGLMGMLNAISEEKKESASELKIGEEEDKSTSPKSTNAAKKSILGMLNAISERGEALEETNESASKLKNEAVNFKSLARQIMEQERKKKENDAASKIYRMAMGAIRKSKVEVPGN